MNRNTVKGILAFLGMLVLILDGKTALSGAIEGIELCIRTVIPSLFPFFVLSIIMTSALSCSSTLLRPLGRLCSLPSGTEPLLISGFLGGYPVGAQNVSQFYHDGLLSRQDAQRLLAFCNNAGPAFIFGMIAPLFSQKWIAWILWGIHIASALLTSRFFSPSSTKSTSIKKEPVSLPDALNSALRITSGVCGWVILFRVIIAFIRLWFLWRLPITAQVAVTGILELTNGCCELSRIESETARFVLCSGLLGFGGLCVTMQTSAVTGGLSLKKYICGKAMQTLFSLILSSMVVRGYWQLIFVIVGTIIFLSKNAEKRVAIKHRLMYNKATF